MRTEGQDRSVKATILATVIFRIFAETIHERFDAWRVEHDALLRGLEVDSLPRQVIHTLSEDLLERFTDVPLLSRYDVYQRLMDYWPR